VVNQSVEQKKSSELIVLKIYGNTFATCFMKTECYMGLIDSIIHPEGTNFTVLFMICILFGFLQLKLTHRVTDQQLGQSAVDTMKSGNICKIDTSDSGQQVFFVFCFLPMKVLSYKHFCTQVL